MTHELETLLKSTVPLTDNQVDELQLWSAQLYEECAALDSERSVCKAQILLQSAEEAVATKAQRDDLKHRCKAKQALIESICTRIETSNNLSATSQVAATPELIPIVAPPPDETKEQGNPSPGNDPNPEDGSDTSTASSANTADSEAISVTTATDSTPPSPASSHETFVKTTTTDKTSSKPTSKLARNLASATDSFSEDEEFGTPDKTPKPPTTELPPTDLTSATNAALSALPTAQAVQGTLSALATSLQTNPDTLTWADIPHSQPSGDEPDRVTTFQNYVTSLATWPDIVNNLIDVATKAHKLLYQASLAQDQLSLRNESLYDEIERLTQDHKATLDEFHQTQAELKKVSDEYRSLISDYKNQEDILRDTRAAVAQAHKDTAHVTAQLAQKEGQLTDTETKATGLRAALESAQTSAAQHESALHALKTAHNQTVAQNEIQITKLQGELKGVRQSADDAIQQLTQLQTLSDAMQARVTDTESKLKVASDEIASLQSDIDKTDFEKSQLLVSVKMLKIQKGTADKRYADMCLKAQHLQTQIQEPNQQNPELISLRRTIRQQSLEIQVLHQTLEQTVASQTTSAPPIPSTPIVADVPEHPPPYQRFDTPPHGIPTNDVKPVIKREPDTTPSGTTRAYSVDPYRNLSQFSLSTIKEETPIDYPTKPVKTTVHPKVQPSSKQHDSTMPPPLREEEVDTLSSKVLQPSKSVASLQHDPLMPPPMPDSDDESEGASAAAHPNSHQDSSSEKFFSFQYQEATPEKTPLFDDGDDDNTAGTNPVGDPRRNSDMISIARAVGHMEKPHTPLLIGGSEPNDIVQWHYWCRQMSQFFRAREYLTEADRCGLALRMMAQDGPAYTWANSYMIRKPDSTYSELLGNLQSWIMPRTGAKEKARREFEALRQKSKETLQAYSARVAKAAAAAASLDPTFATGLERKMKHHFASTLADETQRQMAQIQLDQHKGSDFGAFSRTIITRAREHNKTETTATSTSKSEQDSTSQIQGMLDTHFKQMKSLAEHTLTVQASAATIQARGNTGPPPAPPVTSQPPTTQAAPTVTQATTVTAPAPNLPAAPIQATQPQGTDGAAGGRKKCTYCERTGHWVQECHDKRLGKPPGGAHRFPYPPRNRGRQFQQPFFPYQPQFVQQGIPYQPPVLVASPYMTAPPPLPQVPTTQPTASTQPQTTQPQQAQDASLQATTTTVPKTLNN